MPCGMITPTFFDIYAIVGLRPMGMDFDPETITRIGPPFSFSRPTYNSFIEDHRKAAHDVSTNEHIIFLSYLLSRYVLFARSTQVAKKYIPLTT